MEILNKDSKEYTITQDNMEEIINKENLKSQIIMMEHKLNEQKLIDQKLNEQKIIDQMVIDQKIEKRQIAAPYIKISSKGLISKVEKRVDENDKILGDFGKRKFRKSVQSSSYSNWDYSCEENN